MAEQREGERGSSKGNRPMTVEMRRNDPPARPAPTPGERKGPPGYRPPPPADRPGTGVPGQRPPPPPPPPKQG